MKKLLYIFALLLLSQFSFAQELNAQVQINYQQIGGSNVHIIQNNGENLKDLSIKPVGLVKNFRTTKK